MRKGQFIGHMFAIAFMTTGIVYDVYEHLVAGVVLLEAIVAEAMVIGGLGIFAFMTWYNLLRSFDPQADLDRRFKEQEERADERYKKQNDKIDKLLEKVSELAKTTQENDKRAGNNSSLG